MKSKATTCRQTHASAARMGGCVCTSCARHCNVLFLRIFTRIVQSSHAQVEERKHHLSGDCGSSFGGAQQQQPVRPVCDAKLMRSNRQGSTALWCRYCRYTTALCHSLHLACGLRIAVSIQHRGAPCDAHRRWHSPWLEGPKVYQGATSLYTGTSKTCAREEKARGRGPTYGCAKGAGAYTGAYTRRARPPAD